VRLVGAGGWGGWLGRLAGAAGWGGWLGRLAGVFARVVIDTTTYNAAVSACEASGQRDMVLERVEVDTIT
jgi:hypothetical protein